ncbi:MAG TPA: transcriptional repressor [Cytophagales bacterium]|nr:transcriptional repressor [Cytophagales bacterium]
MKEIKEILKDHQLKVTDCRIQMLELFHKERKTITHGEIEKSMSVKHDRVTVYRTLHSFLEKNIIHKISSPDHVSKYALCTVEDHCHACKDHTEHVHNTDHLHFVCERCMSTTCIDTDLDKLIPLPSGFKLTQANVTLSGLCSKCSK